MDAYYADEFVLPLPEGHRFPMAKYRLLRDRIAEELPETRLHVSPKVEDEELARVHSPEYIAAIAQGTLAPAAQREIGFPWSEAMAERARRSVGRRWRQPARPCATAWRATWRGEHTTPTPAKAVAFACSMMWRWRRVACRRNGPRPIQAARSPCRWP